MTSAPDTVAALRAVFEAVGLEHGPGRGSDTGEIVVEPLSSGASRVTAVVRAGDHRLMLQQRRADGAESRVPIDVEVAVLRAAAAAGVPVPSVVAGTPDRLPGAESLGAYVVTTALDGEALPQRLLRDPAVVAAGDDLAFQLGRHLATIHSLDVSLTATGGATPLPSGPAAAEAVLAGLPDAHPVLEYGLRRLRLEQPDPRPPVLCHGDYRLGNVLVETGADGPVVTGVLDWELCHPGDPRSDLAWLCCPTWRFGGEHPVAGVGGWQALLDGYAAGGGDRIEVEELRWFLAAASIRWALICQMQADAHLSGTTPSLELAVIGRRTSAAEADLLDALEPTEAITSRAGLADPVPSSGPGPFHRPSAASLIEAVREHLATELAPRLTGTERYTTLVAIRALEIAGRELAAGSEVVDEHRARLQRLGVADERALSAAIRAGAFDDRWGEVHREFRSWVATRVMVDDPARS